MASDEPTPQVDGSHTTSDGGALEHDADAAATDTGNPGVPAAEPEPMVEPEDEQFDAAAVPGGVRAAIEAILMVVDEPVTPEALASALEVGVDEVLAILQGMREQYAEDERGFALVDRAGGWRFYSTPEAAPVVEKFLRDGQRAKLTQASLETLAVIAYRQPISRARVGAVRGVNVDGVVRTLVARGLITEVGHDHDGGGAVLYGTTPYFLQRMGLRSLDELPPLAPYLPDEDMLDELAAQGQA